MHSGWRTVPGLAPGKTPLEVELGLLKRIPKELVHNAHHWLILHGRYVCKARAPECWRCVGAPWCKYPAKTEATLAKHSGVIARSEATKQSQASVRTKLRSPRT